MPARFKTVRCFKLSFNNIEFDWHRVRAGMTIQSERIVEVQEKYVDLKSVMLLKPPIFPAPARDKSQFALLNWNGCRRNSVRSHFLFLFAARGLNGLSISLSTSTSLNFPQPVADSRAPVYCYKELKDYVLIARKNDALSVRLAFLSLSRNRWIT